MDDLYVMAEKSNHLLKTIRKPTDEERRVINDILRSGVLKGEDCPRLDAMMPLDITNAVRFGTIETLYPRAYELVDGSVYLCDERTAHMLALAIALEELSKDDDT